MRVVLLLIVCAFLVGCGHGQNIGCDVGSWNEKRKAFVDAQGRIVSKFDVKTGRWLDGSGNSVHDTGYCQYHG